MRRLPFLLVVALAFSAGPLLAQPTTGCDELCTAAAALVKRFDLREGGAPVRERKDWRVPEKIVVADVPLADTLRGVLPKSIEVVGVPGLRNFAADTLHSLAGRQGARMAAGADRSAAGRT